MQGSKSFQMNREKKVVFLQTSKPTFVTAVGGVEGGGYELGFEGRCKRRERTHLFL